MGQLLQNLLFIGFFVSCVVAEPLVGTKVSAAKNGDFPFAVSMGTAPANSTLNHFCMGTLISNSHVLTCAHCVEVDNVTKSYMVPSKIRITVGTIDVREGIKHEVKTWKTFEEWVAEKNFAHKFNMELKHDIAIVTLIDEVEDIKPARLPDSNRTNVCGEDVVTAGWGITNFGIRPIILQKAELKVLSQKTCLKNLKANNYDLFHVENHLCTNATPSISLGCGDSGGPLLIDGDELVGVNDSTCEEHDDPGQQNLHMKVDYYREFIMDFIGST